LFLEDVRVPALTEQLVQEEQTMGDFSTHPDLLACRNDITDNHAMRPQKIWTDGASPHNQDSRFRRAGSGIYYGLEHIMNWSGILPGLAQSNQRAELFAVLVACLRDPRPLDIRSDSEWVCKGFSSLSSWVSQGWQGEHADLWNMLACEVSSRACDVSVSWCKGHATWKDVDRGRTTSEDKIGNDGADKLAVDGAAKHRVPPEVVAAAKARRQTAKRTHEMMLEILIERQRQEALLVENDPDRGSEMGDKGLEFDDCMELLDDEFDDGENIQSDVH
jgi:ribonuclease HI